LDVQLLSLAELLGRLPILDQPHLALDVLTAAATTAVAAVAIEAVAKLVVENVVVVDGVGVLFDCFLLLGSYRPRGLFNPWEELVAAAAQGVACTSLLRRSNCAELVVRTGDGRWLRLALGPASCRQRLWGVVVVRVRRRPRVVLVVAAAVVLLVQVLLVVQLRIRMVVLVPAAAVVVERHAQTHVTPAAVAVGLEERGEVEVGR
jgi:hypothetical protein